MADAWRLTIEKDNGQCLSVCGTEDLLREELDAWQRFENASVEEGSQLEAHGQMFHNYPQYLVRTLTGWSNDASRSDVVIAYRYVDVIGMVLVRL